MSRKCTTIKLFSINLKTSFNALQIDRPFSTKNMVLILGHEDGVVDFFDLPFGKSSKKDELHTKVLETKGGPIQHLLVHNLTRLYGNDIVVADSRGNLTFICNEQILCRRPLSDTCITCMEAHTDPLGNVSVIIGDRRGHVTSLNPYSDLWRVPVSEAKTQKSSEKTPAIRCILPIELQTSDGQMCTYVLASDDAKRLHFIQSGVIVKTIVIPHLVNSMCAGHFVHSEQLEYNETSNSEETLNLQVALGTETGAVYIMSNFEVYSDEYVNIQVPIKVIKALKVGEGQSVDILLCIGQFNGLSIIQNGKEIDRHSTQSWVSNLVLADIDSDGLNEVLIGASDNTIHGLKIKIHANFELVPAERN